jgi:hypothetical protein
MKYRKNVMVERGSAGVMPGIAPRFPYPASPFPLLHHSNTPLLQNNYTDPSGSRE